MEKTTKDFQCDNCEGFGKIQDDDSTLMPCPACNGSGKSDSAIAAYFRDRLEDALAGVRIIQAVKEESIYIMKDMKAVEVHNGKIVCDMEDEKGLQECSSITEAIDKLLS